jgi:hypothetical protein
MRASIGNLEQAFNQQDIKKNLMQRQLYIEEQSKQSIRWLLAQKNLKSTTRVT